MLVIVYNTESVQEMRRVRQAVLGVLHSQNIHQERWSWVRSSDPVEVTDDGGFVQDSERPIVVQLPSVQAVRDAVNSSNLQEHLSGLGIIVFTLMAPVEVSIGGNRM